MSGNASFAAGKIPTLADFTSETLILPELRARDMAGAIEELSAAFQRTNSQWDAQKLNQAALEHELQTSTTMDFGAAFPHVRSMGCPCLQFAFGRAATPFVWGRPGSLQVQFIFLNAVPVDDAKGYLKLLSGLARLGKEPAFVEQLRVASGAHELREIFSKIPLRK